MADSIQAGKLKDEAIVIPPTEKNADKSESKALESDSLLLAGVKPNSKNNDLAQLGFANITLIEMPAAKALSVDPVSGLSRTESAFNFNNSPEAKQKFMENLHLTLGTDGPPQSRMQERIIKLLPGFINKENASENANLLKQVEDEKSRGEFGNASKTAYKLIVGQLENTFLPALSQEMGQIGLVEKEDPNAQQQPLSIGINTDLPPQNEDVGKLDEAINWILTAQVVADAANMQTLQNDIKTYALPKSWSDALGTEQSPALETMRSYADAAIQAKVQIKIMNELSCVPGGEQFKNNLPQGAQVVRGENNEIKHIDLALPDAAALSTPEGQARMKELTDWVSNQRKILMPIVSQLEQLSSNSERAVYWGDMERTQTKARIDRLGNLVGLTGDAGKPGDGETLQSVNLISSDFNVVPKGNKIEVNQEVQAKSVPWWSYQNLFGAQEVGKRLSIRREFDKTELVVVPNNNGFSLIKAENLSSYKGTQQTWYYGEKVGMSALDIGLTVSGFELLRGGVAAAQLSKVALTSALRASAEVAATEGSTAATRVLRWQLASGTTRMTVGLSGVINNAGARESKLGEYANNARQFYFLATAVTGLAPGSLRSLVRNTAFGAEGSSMLASGGVLNTLNAADKLKAINGLIDKVNVLPSTGLSLMAGVQMVDFIRAKRSQQLLHAEMTLKYADILNKKY